MAVRVVLLGSGSSGNATLVEFGRRRLLVDAGLAPRTLAERLRGVGVAPESLSAILLSHEHQDHARGVEIFSRRYAVPVASALETLEALDLSPAHLARFEPFVPGRRFELEDVEVDPFVVPHDAACPVGFALSWRGVKVGIATDLGHTTSLVAETLAGCHVLVVEANHDDRMLREGPYPWPIKQRVGGRLGHLSNEEAAELLVRAARPDCRAVVLAHLSERNNTPALARRAASVALARAGLKRFEMRVAETRRPTPAIVLEGGT